MPPAILLVHQAFHLNGLKCPLIKFKNEKRAPSISLFRVSCFIFLFAALLRSPPQVFIFFVRGRLELHFVVSSSPSRLVSPSSPLMACNIRVEDLP